MYHVYGVLCLGNDCLNISFQTLHINFQREPIAGMLSALSSNKEHISLLNKVLSKTHYI